MRDDAPAGPGADRSRHETLRARVARSVADEGVPLVDALCLVAARTLDFSGVVVRLMTADHPDNGVQQTIAAACPPAATRLDDLEYDVGEGPGREAHLGGRPVLVPDLEEAVRRWPAYAPAAISAGARSTFAFPLHVGAVRLGVLSLHCTQPRDLTQDEIATSLTLARIATSSLLESAGPAEGAAIDPALFGDLAKRDRVYQAQGMASVQLRLSLADSLSYLRAHAYATGQDLASLCEAVVAGEVRLIDLDSPP